MGLVVAEGVTFGVINCCRFSIFDFQLLSIESTSISRVPTRKEFSFSSPIILFSHVCVSNVFLNDEILLLE